MTGYINHDVYVQVGETIVGIREESYYGESFLCINDFIGMFQRELYGSEFVKKNRYWPTKIYGYGINANCIINKQVIMNTYQDIEGAFNFMCLL